jgi:NADH:ubiquinone reductase (H+-translocating)
MSHTVPHVVVVGAGFGGLQAVRAMDTLPVRITLIDRHNYHLFQPLLYQVATAGLAAEDIAYPVRKILRQQRNADFYMTEVTGINTKTRFVQTVTGDMSYDYLILAVGGKTNFFGMESVAQHSVGLKTLQDAINARNQILRMFELAAKELDIAQRRAMLTFVIVGGGPTGVESAGALSELIRLVLKKDYPHMDFRDVRILLLEGCDRLLAGMPEPLSEVTAHILMKKKVEVRFGSLVPDFNGETISLKSGEKIAARTLIWAAGIQAEAVVNTLGVKQAWLGRVVVNSTLQLAEYPDIFVIGDAAEVEGQPLPMIAPVAIQQAAVVADNIKRSLEGEKLQPFVYKDVGALATIGRNAAVARWHRWQFHGFFAWILWLFIHLIRIVGFRNRLLVLMNWAWDYWFYDRAVRLIIPK